MNLWKDMKRKVTVWQVLNIFAPTRISNCHISVCCALCPQNNWRNRNHAIPSEKHLIHKNFFQHGSNPKHTDNTIKAYLLRKTQCNTISHGLPRPQTHHYWRRACNVLPEDYLKRWQESFPNRVQCLDMKVVIPNIDSQAQHNCTNSVFGLYTLCMFALFSESLHLFLISTVKSKEMKSDFCRWLQIIY